MTASDPQKRTSKDLIRMDRLMQRYGPEADDARASCAPM